MEDGTVDMQNVMEAVREVVDAETIAVLSEALAEDAGVQNSAYETAMQPEMLAEESEGDGEEIITVSVTDSAGTAIEPEYHFEELDGATVLVIEKQNALRPGKYTITTTVQDPLSGEEQVLTRDFTWGVLALNPNQDVYRPDQVANIAIGVLDDAGKMVCDATVQLVVKEPNGSTVVFSTEDESITVSDTCALYEAGLIDPDYETYFRLSQAGTYELTLQATTANGTRTARTEIEVETAPAIIVERTAATRLWPAALSPMTIEVHFAERFAGTITDTLPAGFTVQDVSNGGAVTVGEDGVAMRWQGSWSAGESVTLSYQYDAPDTSPEFYLVGPLRLAAQDGTLYEERRTWQIANDATGTISGTVYTDNGTNDIGALKTIQLVKNGTAQTTADTDANGVYSFTNVVMTGGTIIAVYITGESEKGATVTVASGSSITNLHIYKNDLIVRSDSGAVAMTNGRIAAATNGGASINEMYTVDNGVLNVKSGKDLLVWERTTYTPGAGVNVGSGIVLQGTFNAGSNTVTLSGAWINTSSGSFVKGTSTVILDGTNQSMTGNTVFYHLRKMATVRDTLTLAVGMRQAVSGSLIIQGATGSTMELKSSQSGTLAKLVLFGYSNAFQDIKRLRVQDMSGSGTVANRAKTLNCTRQCADKKHNENWTFTSPVVTGTLYSNEGTTPITSATVAISYNGGTITEQVAVGAGGQFSLSGGVMTGGTIITLFVNNSSDHAVTILLGSGSSMTGISLYEDRLILRSESGSVAITNAHIAVADDKAGNADSDITNIISAATPSALTVASAKELFIWSGDTFRPQGTVVAHDFDINGTLNYQSNSIGVTGSWDATGGTASGNGVISFTSTGSETITSAGRAYNNLTLSGNGGTWALQDAMDVNGTLTLSAGTFNQNGQNLNVSGNVRIANGTVFTAPYNNGTFTLDGDLVYEDEAGVKLGTVQVGTSPDTITLSGSMSVHKLTIGTGDTLVLSGHNLFVGTGGLFIHGTLDATDNDTDNSVIVVSGSWIASGTGDFISGTSTVRFDGISGSYDITSSGSFYNLALNGTGATYTATGSLDINGNIQFSAGTFTAPLRRTMTVAGNWTKGANATFIHNSGSIVLDGLDQTLSGSTAFFNLTKSVTSQQTLTFQSTSETTVSGALTLSGADASNMLLLRASNSAVAALLTLDAGGSQHLEFLNVQRSDASNGETLVCANGADSGNNINWSFSTETVVGTLYSHDRTTELSGKKVSISYNGGAIADTDLTDAGGQFSLSGANMTGGTIVTLYIQDETEDGVAVVLSSGISMTGTHLYKDHLIVRSESGSTAITNAVLALADDMDGTPDADVTAIYAVSAGALTVASGKKLYVWPGTNFVPGGAVTTPEFYVPASATFNAGSSAIDINGPLTVLGTFIHGTNTLNISGNVRIAAGSTFTRSGNNSRVIFDGDLTYEDETGVSIGNVQIGTSPDTVQLSGSSSNSTITVSGSWLATGTGDFIAGTSTVLFDGTSGSHNITASGAFYHLIINGTGATYAAAGTIDVDGNVQLSAGTFTATSGTMTLSGSWTRGGNATFNHNSGTVNLNGTDQTISGSTVFYNLTKTVTASQTLT
ncbi:MAG: hypothetical protein UY90_C0074G0004, partial [Candidatus Peregrinibacteria bacterium GW2011_GWA2_54_9]